MIIKKILETYLDITDPNDIFSPNRDNMIMEKLTAKFVGVCYMSCFVVKINKVIRRSYIYMKDTLDGDVHTNVMFEVDAIVYQKNEIINGCKIIKKEPNGIIHGKSDHAGIQLSIQPNMSIFKEGDIVPVIVKRVRYNVNQTAASVLAVPFIPMPFEPVFYNIVGSLSKQQITDLKSLLSQIKTEEENIKKMNVNDKKIYTFFVDLISPSKTTKDNTKLFKNSKKIDINNILELKSGIVYRPNLKYDDSTIYHVDTQDTSKDMVSNLSSILEEQNSKLTTKKLAPSLNNIIDESIYVVLYELIIKYLTNIQSLQNFLIQYPTFATIQQSKEIWKMYSMLKK
jgi:hypothetical protein